MFQDFEHLRIVFLFVLVKHLNNILFAYLNNSEPDLCVNNEIKRPIGSWAASYKYFLSFAHRIKSDFL